MDSYKIAIVGAGTAGITGCSQLLKYFSPSEIVIIEPSDTHYYQPLWTLVGAGVTSLESTARPMASVIPSGVKWIKEYVDTFSPEENKLKLRSGKEISYEYLLAAPGIQLDFNKIKGLEGNWGKNGLCSNYSKDTVESTWEVLKNFKGGTAVFTFPSNPIKCAGAPQKIMWLAEETFRQIGIRGKTKVIFLSAGQAIFGIEKYKKELEKLAEKRGIEFIWKHNLIEVDVANKKLKAEHTETKEILEMSYDMLHVTPPMSAPNFVKESPISTCHHLDTNQLRNLCSPITPTSEVLGYIDVDKFTTQHERFKNIFSIGDASSLPCSKTGAAVRKQAPVMAKNLHAYSQGKELPAKYDGYASCPLVVDRSHVILAEFGYDGKILETFPFNQAKPSKLMWILKRYLLPIMYWKFMLKGKA